MSGTSGIRHELGADATGSTNQAIEPVCASCCKGKINVAEESQSCRHVETEKPSHLEAPVYAGDCSSERSLDEKGPVPGDQSDSDEEMDLLQQLILARLGIGSHSHAGSHIDKPEDVLCEFTLTGVAEYMNSEKCKKIIVLSGAGISTSAGIPDFRTPGSGLYSQLEKYNLPTPHSIFDISYFKNHPEPFYKLAKELYPGNFKATPSHYFIKLLAEKKLLLRAYTQNIDGLELVAGIDENLLVAAHGTFHTSHCINKDCRRKYSEPWMKEKVFADVIPTCENCRSLVKPDIVFFGESLPNRFFQLMQQDFPVADLLIVMGTSLVVQPFASLIDRVKRTTPRLLINLEKVGRSPMASYFGGFDFDSENRYRDVAWLGACDDGCLALAELLGWKDQLDVMITQSCQPGSDKS